MPLPANDDFLLDELARVFARAALTVLFEELDLAESVRAFAPPTPLAVPSAEA
jgi:hypothetical protein